MEERLDITYAPLLENLLEISFPSGKTVDLHNDFICQQIEYEAGTLLLRFQAVNDNAEDPGQIVIEFSDTIFMKLAIDSDLSSEALGLGTLERTRCLIEGKVQDEFPDGKVAFLIAFYPSILEPLSFMMPITSRGNTLA